MGERPGISQPDTAKYKRRLDVSVFPWDPIFLSEGEVYALATCSKIIRSSPNVTPCHCVKEWTKAITHCLVSFLVLPPSIRIVLFLLSSFTIERTIDQRLKYTNRSQKSKRVVSPISSPNFFLRLFFCETFPMKWFIYMVSGCETQSINTNVNGTVVSIT